MKTCTKCNSEKIVPNAQVLDEGQYASGYLKIAVDENPDALFFKSRTQNNVKVFVCGDCGFIEFYAESPQTLYEAYQDTLKKQ
ncbi:hypothetical protein BH10ACI1_BH10ACI1_23320 [soil metagenome]